MEPKGGPDGIPVSYTHLKVYETADIRNIGIVGHGSEGKTTLTEAMLFAANVIERMGRVEDGTTTTDFDPEEAKRGISIGAAMAPVEWNNCKINAIDVPGYFDFVGEMVGALQVSDSALIVPVSYTHLAFWRIQGSAHRCQG